MKRVMRKNNKATISKDKKTTMRTKDNDDEEQQDMVMTQIGYGIVIRWYFEVDANICIFLNLSEYGRVGGLWQWLGFCTAACAPPSDPLWA